MSTPTLAKDLQDAAAAWIAAGAEFAGVTVLSRRQHTIVSDIDAAVAQLGVCIYILPGLPVSVKDVPGPYCDKYEIRARVIEDPALNSGRPDCYELTEYVLRRLHLQQFDAIPGMNPLVVPENGRPVIFVPDPERVIHDVVLETSVGLLPRQEN